VNVLAYAARRQWQVFAAVVYRETVQRFGRRSLGFIEEAGSIAIHVLVFSMMRMLSGTDRQNGMPILPFICIGVYNFWLFRTGIAQIPSALTAVKSYGAFAQVTPLDVALGRGTINVLLYTGLAISSFVLLQLLIILPLSGTGPSLF